MLRLVERTRTTPGVQSERGSNSQSSQATDADDGTALANRVGIDTRLVVVGDLIGQGAAQEQAVVGETPNLAPAPRRRRSLPGLL
jgi:hypothetical protein